MVFFLKLFSSYTVIYKYFNSSQPITMRSGEIQPRFRFLSVDGTPLSKRDNRIERKKRRPTFRKLKKIITVFDNLASYVASKPSLLENIMYWTVSFLVGFSPVILLIVIDCIKMYHTSMFIDDNEPTMHYCYKNIVNMTNTTGYKNTVLMHCLLSN